MHASSYSSNPRTLQVFTGHAGPVRCGQFTPDGKHVITGGGEGDESMKVWDPKSGACSLTVQDSHSYHTAGMSCSRGPRSPQPGLPGCWRYGTRLAVHASADLTSLHGCRPHSTCSASGLYNRMFRLRGCHSTPGQPSDRPGCRRSDGYNPVQQSPAKQHSRMAFVN